MSMDPEIPPEASFHIDILIRLGEAFAFSDRDDIHPECTDIARSTT